MSDEGERVMTIRLSETQAEKLEVVARAFGLSIAETIRKAVDAHIESRQGDKEVVDLLRRKVSAWNTMPAWRRVARASSG